MRKSKKALAGIAAATALVIAGVIGGGYLLTGEGRKNFPADGYVLEVASGEEGQSVTGLTFSAGTQYRGKFPASYIFHDIQGAKNKVEAESYIHYNDGSISAFTDGVAVNMQEVGGGFLEFYQIGAGMVMAKNDSAWEIDNNRNMLSFPELMWELSEEKVLAASDNMTLNLSGREAENVSGYLEVTWLDKDVVQVADAEHVYQTVVTDGNITFASGAVLDFAEKAVKDAEGEALFTVAELQADMAEGAVSVQSDSAVNWQPPQFNIQTENGKDGEAGESGENGEIGENGESGEDGEEGDYGEDGETGQAGNAGAAGAEGSAGETGAGGGSAGSGGSSGSGGAVAESDMGTLRLKEIKYDCASVTKVVLEADDYADDTLVGGTGIIEIRDVQTNRQIGVYRGESINGKTTLEFGDGVTSTDGIDNPWRDKLSPDREYALIVKWDYQIERAGNLYSTGTKTFVNRSFFTSSDGVTVEEAVRSEGGATLLLRRDPASGMNSYALRITVGTQTLYYPDKTNVKTIPANDTDEIQLNLSELLKEAGASEQLSSDIPYTVELYTAERSSGINPGWDASGEPSAASGLRKSRQVLNGRTLKKKPVIGEVKALLSKEGYYELVANVEEDKDNSIKSYEFIVTDVDNNVIVQRINSTANRAQWYFGNGITGSFEVACQVTYFDNEKDNMVSASQPASIQANSTGAPSVIFRPYRKNDSGGIEDDKGNFIAASDVSPVNATRIWGDLVLNMNGKELDSATEITIDVTSSDDSTYHSTISRSLSAANVVTGEEGIYYIPVKRLGLKQNTVYTFSVSGKVLITTSIGAASATDSKVMWLGSTSVKTSGLFGAANETEISEGLPIAGFVMENILDDTRDNIAQFTLYFANAADRGDLSEPNAVNPESPYYFNRSIARAAKIGVYNGTAHIGTIIKELYDPGWNEVLSDTRSDASAELEPSGELSAAEAEFFFNGPLIDKPDKIYTLTAEDFNKAGINIKSTEMSGTIDLRIEALYDYAYDLQSDADAYNRNFDVPGEQLPEGVTYYNVMPLSDKKADYGLTEASSVKKINQTSVDLGVMPPTLANPAYEAVTLTEIKNNEIQSLHVDGLQDETTIGLKVAPNFDDSNKQTNNVTYYGMEVDAYQSFSGAGTYVDIIDAARRGQGELYGVPVIVTLDKSYFSSSGTRLPVLHVIFTKDPKLLESCPQEEVEETIGGETVKRKVYKATKDASGRAILYTDKMERGHSYLFGFTLESTYRVDMVTGADTKGWTFPYDVAEYTTQVYTGAIQRSVGVTVYKETPRAAAYLDHTTINGRNGQTENSAVWNYLVYDPDGALWEESGKPVAYAGTVDNMVTQISKDLKLPTSSNPPLLSCEVEDYQTITADAYNALDEKGGIRTVFSKSFGLSAFPGEGKLKEFRVTVKDRSGGGSGSGIRLEQYNSSPYQVWLREKEFLDDYISVLDGEGKERLLKYIEEDRSTGTEASRRLKENAAYYRVATAENTFDNFSASMEGLSVKADVSDGSDNLTLSVTLDAANAEAQKKHIVGFYYELKEKNGDKVKQWGFALYNEADSRVTIPLDKPATGEEIKLYLRMVYDTGIAGLNRGIVVSSTHKLPESEEEAPSAAPVDNFYALQTQSATLREDGGIGTGKLPVPANYAQASNENTNLSFARSTASGSLYQIRKAGANGSAVSDDGDDKSEKFSENYRAKEWNRLGAKNSNGSAYAGQWMQYTYAEQGGHIGSITGMRFPVLKALAEAEVTLTYDPSNAYIKEEGGDLVITTPPTTPNVTASSVAVGIHSADITVEISKKTIETLRQDGLGYDGRVYLELQESDGTTVLPNENNCYFGFVTDEEASQYDNQPGTRGTGGSVVEAYFVPKLENKGTGDQEDWQPVFSKIAVRNLEQGKSYILRLYYERTESGTTTRHYLRNAIEGSTEIGQDYAGTIRTTDNVVIRGRYGAVDTAPEASYTMEGYDSQKLTLSYYISSLKDYDMNYTIYSETGTISTLSHEALMNRLGYFKKTGQENKNFYYYEDGTWKERDIPVYQQEDGTEYGLTGNHNTVEFRMESNDLPGGNYVMKLEAKDRYTQKPLVEASAPFLVSPRAAISVTPPNATYRKGETSGVSKYYITLPVHVKDDGYRLGLEMGDGTVTQGVYQVNLTKITTEAGGTTKEETVDFNALADNTALPAELAPGLTPADSSSRNGIFTKGITYLLRYEVKIGERYRITVTGRDSGSTEDRNKLLYDSDKDAAVRANLTVPDMSTPQMKTMSKTYSPATQVYTIKVKNGTNMDQIKSVAYTLQNMSKMPPVSGSGTVGDGVAAVFGEPDAKGWQTIEIPLADILGRWATSSDSNEKVEEGDSLQLTLQFLDGNGSTLPIEFSETISY